MNENLRTAFNDYGRLLAYAALAVLVLLGLFLLAKTVDAFDRMGKSPYAGPNVITVTGTGKSETPPTIARVVFTTRSKASTVAEAQEKASERTRVALDAVRELGIENDDVQAAGYQTNPQYAYPTGGAPRVTGYQVSQTVTVKIRNTDRAGEVLQALGNAGVQNIDGPNFEVDDASAVTQEARGKAIEDARKNARTLANQLGVRLGDVVSFSENGGPMPMPMYNTAGKGGVMMDSTMAREQAANVPVPQGQNESVVTVVITYEID